MNKEKKDKDEMEKSEKEDIKKYIFFTAVISTVYIALILWIQRNSHFFYTSTFCNHQKFIFFSCKKSVRVNTKYGKGLFSDPRI